MTDAMLEQLLRRLPDAPRDEDTRTLLQDLLKDAEAWICAYTRRAAVPEGLSSIAVRLAVVSYNRMGLEGETAHGEGGTSRTIESVPRDIREALAPYRLARTVG